MEITEFTKELLDARGSPVDRFAHFLFSQFLLSARGGRGGGSRDAQERDRGVAAGARGSGGGRPHQPEPPAPPAGSGAGGSGGGRQHQLERRARAAGSAPGGAAAGQPDRRQGGRDGLPGQRQD